MSQNLTPDFNRSVHCLLGLPFDTVSLTRAESHIRFAISNHAPFFFSTPNLNFLITAQTDPAFRNSVINSELSVADGMPIVWLAKMLGIPIQERVAGSDLFDALRFGIGQTEDTAIKVFFFGGQNGVAEKACLQINTERHGLRCVGFLAPGFGTVEDMSNDGTIKYINESEADFLVVSLGARKGQAWIEHNRANLNIPVMSHLGAVVNFVAGQVKRAPRWIQDSGLEWLWRIKEEPDLWRRYFKDGIGFSMLLVTRVLPAAFYLWYLPRTLKLPVSQSISCVSELGVTQIRVTGAWFSTSLDPLRSACLQAARAGFDVELDLSMVQMMDSAFLGLILLMYGHQTKNRLRFKIIAASVPALRVIKFSGAQFLL